jgi:dTDP-4-dehydrorhamnose reductase
VELLLEHELWGVCNMVCGGATSRLEVAQELVRLLGKDSKIKVTPVTCEFFAEVYFAPRPPSERLIPRKLTLRGLNIMRDCRVCLEEYLDGYYKSYL